MREQLLNRGYFLWQYNTFSRLIEWTLIFQPPTHTLAGGGPL